MVDRVYIKKDVIKVLDILSPLNLSTLDDNAVEKVRIGYSSGFDNALKAALCIPFGKIARNYGGDSARIISYTETSELKTIKGAIDLTLAASEGKEYEGEAEE